MSYLVVCLAFFLSPWTDCDPNPVNNSATVDDIMVVDHEKLLEYIQAKNAELVVVNFWATWCKPCVDELPHFIELGESFGSDQMALIMVSLDFPNQIDSKLKPFLEKTPLPGEVILLDDPKANVWIEKFSKEWSGAIPATIVYRKSGIVSFKEGKFDSYGTLKDFVLNK